MIPSIVLPWVEFALCVALVGVAGVKLSVFGDVIADKTGLGGSWIGVIMLATVTSLPELVTGVVAVTADLPDIAVGDALGACVINLFIFVLLDLLHRGPSVYQESSQGHILSASFGVIMLGVVGFSIILAHNGVSYGLWNIALSTPILAITYSVAVRSVWHYEKTHVAAYAAHGPDQRPDLSLMQAVARYAIAAVAVVAAGIALPFVGEHIARDMGWNHSFVGSILVALATTVPEMVVSVAAMRIGALDMAVGNLLGSNLFNMLVLAVDDAFYSGGPLLARASSVHAVSAFSAVMMTALAIIGLFSRPKGRVMHSVAWTSLFLFLINSVRQNS